MKYFVIPISLFTGVFFLQAKFYKYPPQKDITAALNKSLPLLQNSCITFLHNAGCVSCHSQSLGSITFSIAKEHGFKINDSVINISMNETLNRWHTSKKALAEGADVFANIEGGYALWALAQNNFKSNKTIELLIHHLLSRQTQQGYWRASSYRPPMEYSDITATALDIKGILQYVPASQKENIEKTVSLARSWLSEQPAQTNEERVFQLLGLKWSAAAEKVILKNAKILISHQHPDGGWSQLDSLSSDAYATGQTLYALHKTAALPVTDDVYIKGINFLLRTQFNDGSWLVISRSHPVIPFVESGFPHDKDQFISAAGSSWATIALLMSAN